MTVSASVFECVCGGAGQVRLGMFLSVCAA